MIPLAGNFGVTQCFCVTENVALHFGARRMLALVLKFYSDVDPDWIVSSFKPSRNNMPIYG